MRSIDPQLPHRFKLACIENTIAEKADFQPIDRARSWQRYLHATSQQFFASSRALGIRASSSCTHCAVFTSTPSSAGLEFNWSAAATQCSFRFVVFSLFICALYASRLAVRCQNLFCPTKYVVVPFFGVGFFPLHFHFHYSPFRLRSSRLITPARAHYTSMSAASQNEITNCNSKYFASTSRSYRHSKLTANTPNNAVSHTL